MLACIVVIGVADLLIWRVHVSYGVQALLDEPAHVAIGVLALAAIGISFSVPVVLAAVAGSLLIDLDHLPRVLGSDVLEHGVPRPYPHSVWSIALVLLIAVVLRDRAHRRLALVFAAALCLHFFRDMAEPGGPGVSMLWPLSDHPFTVGYGWWAGLVALLTGLAIARRIHGGRGLATPRGARPAHAPESARRRTPGRRPPATRWPAG